MNNNAEKVVCTRPGQFIRFPGIAGSCSVGVGEHVELQGEVHSGVDLRWRAVVPPLFIFKSLAINVNKELSVCTGEVTENGP